MPENPSYLDRLYNEIGQYGDRLKATFGGSGGYPEIVKNWGATYQPSYSDSVAEQNRLRLQQAKEEYDLQANAGKLSAEEAFQKQADLEGIGKSIQQLERRTGMPTASAAEIMQRQPSAPADPYAQYLQENREVLKNPEYAALTREEFESYGPPVRIGTGGYEVIGKGTGSTSVPSSVAKMAAATPRQAAARQQQAPAQPQRPMTIREQIAMMPFEGDRYEATRKVMEGAKRAKINEAYAYADAVYGGVATVEGGRFIDNTLKQIEANYVVPKPIEETEDFKTAQKAIVDGKHADRIFMLAEMKNILEAAKIEKTKDGKVALLEPTMGKLLQSIAAGADAMQPAEAQRIISELTNILQSPGESLALIEKRGFLGAFSKDPDAFIEKASKILNATLPAVNERTAFYHNNLGSAFKRLGVGYVTPIGTKNQGIDMTKLQQLREGRQVQSSVFSQTNPADRPAPTGPQIVPGMRFGTSVPSSVSYGSKPMPLNKPMPLGY